MSSEIWILLSLRLRLAKPSFCGALVPLAVGHVINPSYINGWFSQLSICRRVKTSHAKTIMAEKSPMYMILLALIKTDSNMCVCVCVYVMPSDTEINHTPVWFHLPNSKIVCSQRKSTTYILMKTTEICSTVFRCSTFWLWFHLNLFSKKQRVLFYNHNWHGPNWITDSSLFRRLMNDN